MWSEAAKAAMRQAAYRAGMTDSPGSDQLVLVLEPEAAALEVMDQVPGLLSDDGE